MKIPPPERSNVDREIFNSVDKHLLTITEAMNERTKDDGNVKGTL